MQARTQSDLKGVDLSHYETGISLGDLKTQGITVAYLKASEGSDTPDPTFVSFNRNIRALGCKTGAYHFMHFYQKSTVDAQAANFLKQITGQTLDCLPVVDCETEGWHETVSPSAVTAQILDFAAKVRSATGAGVAFYSNTDFIKNHLTSGIKTLPAWIADTRNANAPGENGIVDRWVGFQYSSKGSVGGQTVDLDAFTKEILLSSPFTYGKTAPAPQPKPQPAPQGDPAVKAYQHKLNAVKVRDDAGAALTEDGINGPKTKQAVVRLEKLMGLSVDGGVWGKQCDGAYAQLTGAKQELKSGSQGSLVRYLQYRLGGLTVDGKYGTLTIAAVKKYQRSAGLAVDGIVGVKTWASLMK